MILELERLLATYDRPIVSVPVNLYWCFENVIFGVTTGPIAQLTRV